MPSSWVPVVCTLALLAAFTLDLLTPQNFVAAILLDIPIVLSTLGATPRFRLGLIGAALLANAVAGYANGVHQGHHWDSIGIGDRFLCALSIVLVGYLTFAVDENARRAGRAASLEQSARREAHVAAAIDRVRASLSTELVLRAIALEGLDVFAARESHFVQQGSGAVTLVARRGQGRVDLDAARPAPEVTSLVQRTLDDGDPVVVDRVDALGRLILDTFRADGLIALSIADAERQFGVLLVIGYGPDFGDDLVAVGRDYAHQASNALAQARLFEQLAERNDALEERSAVIRDLVYALSHDLRTPLAALGMTLRQAARGAYGELPERYHEIVERSVVATDDVQQLAETLLLVARFESGDRRPEREVLALADLVRQIVGELEVQAQARHVALAVTGEGAVSALGDRGDIRRAITNLVANALEHTPAGGHVSVGVAAVGRLASIRVSDDGVGLSERARARLFTRFARGDDRAGGGSGLGLYIVRRVAEESGGSVSYEANDPHGSVFTLRLPLVANG